MRCAFSLLLAILLTGATFVPVRIVPAEPQLGTPFLLILELPSEDAELSGISSLSPFELLEPPMRNGRELRLVLLPMRPGEHIVPSFSFSDGPSRQLSSPPLTVLVSEGITADAQIAPLKGLSEGEGSNTAPIVILLAVVCVVAAILLSLYRRRRGDVPPPLESLHGETLLNALSQLIPSPEERNERWQLFAEELHHRRFAPLLLNRDDEMRLLSEYLKLAKEVAS